MGEKQAGVRELPILFSTEMVRAILDGRKTQTRRVIKPQPEFESGFDYPHENEVAIYWKREDSYRSIEELIVALKARYPYQPGDVLWVRETWARLDCSCCEGDFNGICQSEPDEAEGCYMYRATHYITGDARWRPSIHMPREVARLFLTVKEVRVERLNDITEEDAIAEGCDKLLMETRTAKNNFMNLWNILNTKKGLIWAMNPWVWVVSFERRLQP